MDGEVVAAVIAALATAVTSLVLAGYNFHLARQHDLRMAALEERKSQLERLTAADKAKIDYEYEARRNLYSQFEPALFQLLELADYTLERIWALCEPDVWPALAMGEEPVADVGHRAPMAAAKYEIVSTTYALYAPLVIIRSMSRSLTLVDLSLDRRIELQYFLASKIYGSVKDDAYLASLEPRIEYKPFAEGWREKRLAQPATYWWQGLTMGRLETMLDLMTTAVEGKRDRLMTFGEFERRYQSIYESGEESERKSLAAATNPFFRFQMEDRPIYWRMLMAQARLYQALLRTHRLDIEVPADDQDWRRILRLDDSAALRSCGSGARQSTQTTALSATDAYLRTRVVRPWTATHVHPARERRR
jgi:hypothetical protein